MSLLNNYITNLPNNEKLISVYNINKTISYIITGYIQDDNKTIYNLYEVVNNKVCNCIETSNNINYFDMYILQQYRNIKYQECIKKGNINIINITLYTCNTEFEKTSEIIKDSNVPTKLITRRKTLF